MTSARKKIDAFMNRLIERNPGEVEFRQAARKVAGAMLTYGIV